MSWGWCKCGFHCDCQSDSDDAHVATGKLAEQLACPPGIGTDTDDEGALAEDREEMAKGRAWEGGS